MRGGGSHARSHRGARLSLRGLLGALALGGSVLLRTVAIAGAQPGPPVLGPGVRLDGGRFTVVAGPADARLARTLLAAAQAADRFPGLAVPRARVLIAVAPDPRTFRRWVGPAAPEWGAAVAFPSEQRLVMQGGWAGSDAGDPRQVLRHELAHLALHEHMGRLPPRWFDEGYASVAAGEWTREQLLETAVGMVWRTLPTVDRLEAGFQGGEREAGWSYAMAYRAVGALLELGGEAGLQRFFVQWRQSGSFDRGLREAYGMTTMGFDAHWHRQTRRRFGWLALATDVSLAMAVVLLLALPLLVGKRRRDRRRLAELRAAEARQEAESDASALSVLLGAPIAPGIAPPEDPRAPLVALPPRAGSQYPAG